MTGEVRLLVAGEIAPKRGRGYNGAMTTRWIATAEAQTLTGYHSVTLRKLLLSGRVKGRKFGSVWQVDRASLIAYVASVAQLGSRRGPKPKG